MSLSAMTTSPLPGTSSGTNPSFPNIKKNSNTNKTDDNWPFHIQWNSFNSPILSRIYKTQIH